jgi:hypothetical protein
MSISKIGDLELLSFEEHRPILEDRRHDGSLSTLVPSHTTLVFLNLRMPGGEPFTVSTDTDTLCQKILPALGIKSSDMDHLDGLSEVISHHNRNVDLSETETDAIQDPI